MDNARQRYLDFGEFRLDTLERVLTTEGRPVQLTFRCYDLLLTFLNNGGHLLTHEELMRSVWDETSVDRSSLKQTIATLRKALGDVHEEPRYIQTVPKFGYRFIADITSQHDENLVLVAERRSLMVLDYEEQINATTAEAKRTIFNKRLLIGLMAVLVLGVAGFTYWNLRVKSAAKPDFLSYSWRALSASDKEAVAAIAPNGEFIIFLQHVERADSLKMRRLVGEEAITIVQGIDFPIWGLAISHDNNYVYYILAERGSAVNAGTLYRVSVLGGEPRKILEGISGGPTLSPDDRQVAFIRNVGSGISQLVIADAGDGSDLRVISSSDIQVPLWNPAWSPDGKRIVCFTKDRREDGTYYTLVEIPPNGGEITKITKPSIRYIWWHSWMHDGSGLLAVRSDDVTNIRQLTFISYPDGAITKISNDLNQYSAMTASDDGDKIVTNRFERQSDIFIAPDENDAGGDPLKLYACCPDTISWLSDSLIIFDAFADGKRSLWTMAADGSSQHKLFSSDTQDWSPNVSPDGNSIVFLSTRSGSKQIWKCNSDGSNSEQLTQVASDLDSPRYSPDGSYIYFSMLTDSKWKVARIAAIGGEPQDVLDQNIALWDISPDGKSIAYTYWPEGAEKQALVVADIDTKEMTYRSEISSKYLLHWTPDGRGFLFEQPDPNNPSLYTLARQSASSKSLRSTAVSSPLVNYFVAVSPDHRKYAFVRGRLLSSAAMLVRK